MNGLDKITSRIIAEAEEEAKIVLEEAKASADEVLKDFEAKAKNEYDSKYAAGKDEIEQNYQRIERTMSLDAKKESLTLKQELIAKAYELAKKQILEMDEKDYVAFLAKQAGSAAITGNEEVILNEADCKKIGEKVIESANSILKERGLPQNLRLSSISRPISGGLMLKQGDVEVNCSLDTLLELSRNTLDAEIAGILFA